MADELHDAEALARVEAMVDAWLADQLEVNPSVAAVERGTAEERRWYVRLTGEQKSVFSIWLTLGQRTLRYETYVMPAPEENAAELYEHLLRRNRTMFGAAFAIGEEDALYLVGGVPVGSLDEGELDRIIGSVYDYVERFFHPALRIGFASRFAER